MGDSKNGEIYETNNEVTMRRRWSFEIVRELEPYGPTVEKKIDANTYQIMTDRIEKEPNIKFYRKMYKFI